MFEDEFGYSLAAKFYGDVKKGNQLLGLGLFLAGVRSLYVHGGNDLNKEV